MPRSFHRRTASFFILFLLLLSACGRPADAGYVQQAGGATPFLPPAAGTPPPTATTTRILQPTLAPTRQHTPTATAAPTFLNAEGAACGVLLSILPSTPTVLDVPQLNEAAVTELLALAPEEIQPALLYLLENPDHIGLATYRVGQEEEGAYLNAGAPMPLASVVKIVTLVAYVEAAADGSLDPNSTVPLEDVEAFYLPTVDLNAHPRALAALEEEGRIFGDPPAVLLDAVAEMMMTYSSNAATDYLHNLLGQEVLEQTAIDLGLASQTAPCPFLGQFLAMSNHTRGSAADETAVSAYIADPDRYGMEVIALTEAFSSDPGFREQAIIWRQTTRRPNGRVQRLFTDTLNAQGSAADYAALMARLAQNGLSSSESSYAARRLLEWPMRFSVNQEVFTNVGYKGGSLPGVLTSAYYAYPLSDGVPVVASLFFRDLPSDTYRAWRFSQAHDELARWMLYEPRAIPLLRAALNLS